MWLFSLDKVLLIKMVYFLICFTFKGFFPSYKCVENWLYTKILRLNSLTDDSHTKENHFYSSTDSDSEDEEPKKIRIEIKPMLPNNSHHTMASLDELKVSIGNITLSPAISVSKSMNKFILFYLCPFLPTGYLQD